MIEGVSIRKLKVISDERGNIYKMLESTDDEFTNFGEIYFSSIYPGVIKGWHLHKETSLNYAVLKGMIKLVIYDDRKNSKTYGQLQEIIIGEKNYSLVHIPFGVWNGFKCVGIEEAIVADFTDKPHDENDMIRLDPINNELINYDWNLKHR
jgi:dTDP-4-dehydrorhamnose 3,5-epimerase